MNNPSRTFLDRRFTLGRRAGGLAGVATCEDAALAPLSSFAPARDPADRIILHIDMDAFFASVEQRCTPGLDDKPVMVCGNTQARSVVAAANYLAREYGVTAGTPITTARRLCPHGVFLTGDPEKYVYTCIRLNDICRTFSPRVESFSIDESFLDVTTTAHLFGGPIDTARALKARIRTELGLACSVGIGPNKLLAKTASKLEKPDGLTVLTRADIPTRYHTLPIAKLYGIGAQTAKKLEALGVRTIGHLAQVPHDTLKRIFGIIGPMLVDAANGIDHSPIVTDDEQPDPKSVGNGYTLHADTRDTRKLLTVLLGLCSKVGRRLRKGGHAGRTVTLVVRYANYNTISRAQTVEAPIALDRDIFHAAAAIFDRVRRHMAIRYLGVSISKLVPTDAPRQLSLFDAQARTQLQAATRSADAIRDRYGEHILIPARLVRCKEDI